ncbi:MAG: hypothetical protein ACTSQQ_16385 [Candidatus Helarchaeota archaeon]
MKEITFLGFDGLQPLKAYYFMVIYKHNGIVIFSKTSTKLQELPEFDENLVA